MADAEAGHFRVAGITRKYSTRPCSYKYRATAQNLSE